MLLVSKFFPELSVLPFLKQWGQRLVLCALLLPSVVFAADIVVDNKYTTKVPQLTQADKGISQIDIVKPENGISYNRVEQCNVGAAGIVINNSYLGENVVGVGLVGANKNLKNESAKIIVFEVTGAGRSELQGAITIVGDKADFVLVNPNGVICNGCNFVNTQDINIEAKGPVDVVGGLYSANNLNIKAVDFKVDAPIRVDGDFKFIGRNFKNQNTFEAKNINLGLSEDFVNDLNGTIVAKNVWRSTSKGFTNNGKITVGKAFKVQGDYFVNDNGGNVSAGSTEMYLAEKREDGNSLYQGSNSVLESREGGMELIAPAGGMYFGYKKEFTGDGDSKDGFRFVGSQLISYGGPIHIQSGENVIFDGTQVSGDIVVEAKGEVKENKLEGSYKNGVHDVTIKENKVRTVKKSESYTAWGVVGRTKECVNRGPFGTCFGYDWEDHWGNVVYTKEVPVQESYVEETTIHEAHFQHVALNANFVGNKQFFANKGDLLFKEAAIQYEDLSVTNNFNYLKFVLPSDSVTAQENVYRKAL